MAEIGTWKCLTCQSLFATAALHRNHRPNGYCIFVLEGAAAPPHPLVPAAVAHPPAPAAVAHPPAPAAAAPLAAAAAPAAPHG